MMANGIDIDQLAGEITRSLKAFSKEVVDKVNLSSEKVGNAAVKKLKQSSPRDKGNYAKGWTMTTQRELTQPHSRTIHNKKHYHLTHLLEHGHAKVSGGRVEGQPHIRPAEQAVITEFLAEVEEAITGE